jgi:hypothetical protein
MGLAMTIVYTTGPDRKKLMQRELMRRNLYFSCASAAAKYRSKNLGVRTLLFGAELRPASLLGFADRLFRFCALLIFSLARRDRLTA